MKAFGKFALLISILNFGFLQAFAQADSSRRIRICSQNLYQFGSDSLGKKKSEIQLRYLTKRIVQAECDVVAVQEVIGDSESSALSTLNRIAESWGESSGEKVLAYVGKSSDNFIRNGFLVRSSSGKTVSVKSYLDEPIPTLQPLGPVLYFPRAPTALVIETPGLKPNRRFWILNIHQKSRTKGYQDGSGTDFELLRTELAQGIRNIVEREEKSQPENTIFVITGDRNSDSMSASADVLMGARELSDFSKAGGCRIRKDSTAECRNPKPRSAPFVGLFELRKQLFPGDYPGGTYVYKKKQSSLDEFAIQPRYLDLVRRDNGKLSIGLEGEFLKGSDHKLIWAEFHF